MTLTKEDLQAIKHLFDDRFDSIDRRFEQVDRRFDQIDHRIDKLEEDMNSKFLLAAERIDTLEEDMDRKFKVVTAEIRREMEYKFLMHQEILDTHWKMLGDHQVSMQRLIKKTELN